MLCSFQLLLGSGRSYRSHSIVEMEQDGIVGIVSGPDLQVTFLVFCVYVVLHDTTRDVPHQMYQSTLYIVFGRRTTRDGSMLMRIINKSKAIETWTKIH